MPAVNNQHHNGQTSSTGNKPKKTPPAVSITAIGGKEAEKVTQEASVKIEEISPEAVLAPELETAGVTKIGDTIEFPPDITDLTGGQSVSTLPSQTSSQTAVPMPISDDLIYSGSQKSITNTIKWLAEWCIRKLKMAHLVLKNIHGKIIRVKI